MNSRAIDISLEIAALLVLAVPIALFAMHYNSIPETIPTHYNAMGEVDGYGSKDSFFDLFTVNIIMYLVFTILVWLPGLVNLPVKITDVNREHIYAMVPRMLRVYKLLFVAIFGNVIFTIGAEKINPFIPFAIIGIMILYTIYIWYKLRQVSRSVSTHY